LGEPVLGEQHPDDPDPIEPELVELLLGELDVGPEPAEKLDLVGGDRRPTGPPLPAHAAGAEIARSSFVGCTPSTTAIAISSSKLQLPDR